MIPSTKDTDIDHQKTLMIPSTEDTDMDHQKISLTQMLMNI